MASRSVLPALALTVVLGAPLLLAPPLIRGAAALAWVEYYAEQPTLPRPRRATARQLVRKATASMISLAPLPQASEAAKRALMIGERMEREGRDPEAALLVYDGIREACAQTRARPLAGGGFAVLEARAAALADAARRGPAK